MPTLGTLDTFFTETPTLLLNVYRPEIYGELETGDRLCWKLGTTASELYGYGSPEVTFVGVSGLFYTCATV